VFWEAPSALVGLTLESEANGLGYIGTSSSVSLRVHPWLPPLGAVRQRRPL